MTTTEESDSPPEEPLLPQLPSIADKYVIDERKHVDKTNDGDAGSLTGPFINFREIRAIGYVPDFRVAFGLHKDGDRYRIGKQTKTSFILMGNEDSFNKIPLKPSTPENADKPWLRLPEDSFERYLTTSKSWNLMSTVRPLNGTVIYDPRTINVFMIDAFDVLEVEMEESLIAFVEHDFTNTPYNAFHSRLSASSLSEYDRFVYFVRYLHEFVLTTGCQKAYALLERFFVSTKVRLSYFVGRFDACYFADLQTLEDFFQRLPLSNRRECVQYTVRFRDGNLWDTINLTKAITAMLTKEGLDAVNTMVIANAIKEHSVKRELTINVGLIKTVSPDKDDLVAIGLPKNTKDVITYSYEIRLENFTVDNALPWEMSYRRLDDDFARKSVEVDGHVQYTEIVSLLGRLNMEIDVEAIIGNVVRGEMSFGEYTLANVVIDGKYLGRPKKAMISKNDEVIHTLEYVARKQASPRWLVGRRLAVLNVPKRSTSEFNRESNDGLYEHQVRFIERNMEVIRSVLNETTVYAAVVGCGKTTSVVSLAYAIKLMHANFGERKRTVIYTMWSKTVLKELFVKAKEIGLDVLSSFITYGNRAVIKSASDVGQEKSRDIPFEDILGHDILICHPLVLLRHLAVYQRQRTQDTESGVVADILDDVVVVLDELGSDRLNSTTEHALASLLAYNPKHLCVLSASIERHKHINYLRSMSKLTIIENVSIMTPAVLRQMNGRPMDVFCWHPQRPSKVLENSFLRRFLSPENVILPIDFINDMRVKGVFDVATMYEIFNVIGGGQLPSPCEPFKTTVDDEDKRIMDTCLYTLVATSDARGLACRIYGDVIRDVRRLLENSIPHLRMIIADENDIDAALYETARKESHSRSLKGCFKTNKRMQDVIDKVEAHDAAMASIGPSESIGGNARKLTSAEVQNLTAMSNSARFSVQLRNLFAYMATGRQLSSQQVVVLERALMSNEKKAHNDAASGRVAIDASGLTDVRQTFMASERSMLFSISGIQELTSREYAVREAVNKKNELLQKQSDFQATKERYLSSIVGEIAAIVSRHGIAHKWPPRLSVEKLLEWEEEGDEEFVWSTIGVYVEGKQLELPYCHLNRVFAGGSAARGINRPIEAIVITKEYADKVSVDEILQLSGRCGRPGMSEIAVVYMSREVYRRVYNEKASNDVEKIMQRTNFYRQASSQVGILDVPIVRTNESSRLDILFNRISGP